MTTSTNHRASKTIHKSNHKRHRSTSSLQQQSSSSPNKHLILFCKILLVLIILLLLPQLVESKNRKKKRERRLVNKIYNEKRIHCQHSQGHGQQQQGEGCFKLNTAENEMCITKCMHQECHEIIYGLEGGSEELEPGEVDEDKEIRYENCVRDSIKREMVIKK